MIELITNNVDLISQLILSTIGLASIIIKVAPQLDKDHKFKPVLEFIGKYVALNRSNPDSISITPRQNSLDASTKPEKQTE